MCASSKARRALTVPLTSRRSSLADCIGRLELCSPVVAQMAPINSRSRYKLASGLVISVVILIVSSALLAAQELPEEQDQSVELASRSRPVSLQLLQQQPGEKPRLIPIVAAEPGYSENSSVNILCTVSQGHHESLTFDWFKDGQLLSSKNDNNNNNKNDEMISADETTNSNLAPQIEKHSDHSLLRIPRVKSQHSGRYTCAAKNQFGQDSSSVNLIVNGNYIAPVSHM